MMTGGIGHAWGEESGELSGVSGVRGINLIFNLTTLGYEYPALTPVMGYLQCNRGIIAVIAAMMVYRDKEHLMVCYRN